MGFQPTKRKENKITFFELLSLLYTNNIPTRIKYREKEYLYVTAMKDYRPIDLLVDHGGLIKRMGGLSIGELMHSKDIEVLDIVFAAEDDDILIWPSPGITRM